jgi:hypothetical protein
VRRITISKRMRANLTAVNDQLKQRMHQPMPEQGRWLASVVRGHMAYYAVPGNTEAVAAFRRQVTRHWLKALRRRSQKGQRLTWARMGRIRQRWLPGSRDAPLPGGTPRRHTPKVGASAVIPHAGICAGGPPARAVPTATPGDRDAFRLAQLAVSRGSRLANADSASHGRRASKLLGAAGHFRRWRAPQAGEAL